MQGVYLSKYQKCTRAFLLFIGNLKWQKEFGTAPLNILRTSDISFFLSFFLSKSLLDTCLLLKKERKTDRQKQESALKDINFVDGHLFGSQPHPTGLNLDDLVFCQGHQVLQDLYFQICVLVTNESCQYIVVQSYMVVILKSQQFEVQWLPAVVFFVSH